MSHCRRRPYWLRRMSRRISRFRLLDTPEHDAGGEHADGAEAGDSASERQQNVAGVVAQEVVVVLGRGRVNLLTLRSAEAGRGSKVRGHG